jgi:hypothetical protein
MKVTERVEEGSGRIVFPTKLTGTVKLKNTSGNQTVRVVAGKIQYIDAQGQPIELGEARAEPDPSGPLVTALRGSILARMRASSWTPTFRPRP